MPERVRTDRPARLDPPAPPSRRTRDLPEPGGKAGEPSYYDISLLKAPVWKWQIAHYFFWGGISAGSYVLARVAERFGGERYRELTSVGTLVSFLTSLPCAPLLIHDLGDPKRFHHMLRVFKPTTPMNLGTWTLTAHSGVATASVVREYVRSLPEHRRRPLGRLTDTSVLVVQDAAGVPIALLLAGYTGVLLSCTANPLWGKNRWLGPLFTSSAIATGAEAVSLALDVTRPKTPATAQRRHGAQTALTAIDTVAHVAEGIALAGFLREAGEKASPLTEGSMRRHHHVSLGSLIAAEALKLLPIPRPLQRAKRILVALLGLTAGFSMRWGIVHGGHEAANNPDLARRATRTQTPPSNRS